MKNPKHRWLTARMAAVFGVSIAGAFADPAESDIAFAIKQRLLADPAMPLSELDVKVTDGTASLSGTVSNLLAKQRADRIAQSVRGVLIVLNEIKVNAPVIPDEQLRGDIEAALRADAATDSFEVKTAVNAGAATLTGIVESQQEKLLAGQVARSVRGVREVTNKITVEIETRRPDAEIAADIRRTLDMDVWLDARGVDVAVKDGTVSLAGVVGSAAGKARALAQAWVPGAREIDGRKLKVDPRLADDMRGTPRPNPTSTQLEQTLKEAYRRHPRISSFKIGINVHGSVVKLSGIVDNLKAKSAAIRIAESTRGISEVRSDELLLQPPTPPPNSDIAGKVLAAYARDPLLADDQLKVSTGAGIVYLQGKVDSFYEKAHAEDLAAGIKGVVTIANSLDAPAVGESSFEEGSDVLFDSIHRNLEPDTAMPVQSANSDAELQRNVEQELKWSPFVEAEKIQVRVDRGIVTLTGVADSEHGYRAAAANAREGGATQVRNQIKIE